MVECTSFRKFDDKDTKPDKSNRLTGSKESRCTLKVFTALTHMWALGCLYPRLKC